MDYFIIIYHKILGNALHGAVIDVVLEVVKII